MSDDDIDTRFDWMWDAPEDAPGVARGLAERVAVLEAALRDLLYWSHGGTAPTFAEWDRARAALGEQDAPTEPTACPTCGSKWKMRFARNARCADPWHSAPPVEGEA